jgi:tetratricopeptide (TPR) repeat protein
MKKLLIAFSLLIPIFSCFALNSNRLIQNDTTQIKILFSIANKHKNNPDSAIKYYSKALKIAQVTNSKNYIALSFKYIGTNHYYKSDFEKALDFWQKSLQEYKSINDMNGIASLLGNIGIIYEYQGDFQESLKCYEEALSIFEKLGDKKGIAINLGNIGIMYEYQSNYPKALMFYQKALKINEEIGNKNSMASNLANIGVVYRQQGNYEIALSYYEKALKINEEIDNKRGIAKNLVNIGIIRTKNSNYSKALACYQKALNINIGIGSQNIIASNLLNIGVIYEQQGDFNNAIIYYKKALGLNKEIANKRGIAINLINISSIYNKLRKYSSAISYSKEALILSKEINDLYLELNIFSHLSDSYKGLLNLQKAIVYKDLWIELNDSIYNIEKSKAIADIQTRYETEKKDQEIKTLHKDNEIQKLQLEESYQRTKAQRRLFLVFTFILTSVILVILFIYKNYKKQQTINQQKLEYQKILTEQKMLRSQMNPHFIYNSLNSIQSFISSEQSYEAEKYLAKFAKLIRGILENSRANFISLDKEIEVLQLYLSLEQLRFENRFTFNIQVNNSIEEDFISIPPMLLQPFVENAILHGFHNRTNGKININFMEKEDYIICEIDDNGVGRKDSEEKQTQKNHKSLATIITQERLDTLSHELKKEAWFSIEDKIDSNTHESLGTKVTLQIPFIEN